MVSTDSLTGWSPTAWRSASDRDLRGCRDPRLLLRRVPLVREFMDRSVADARSRGTRSRFSEEGALFLISTPRIGVYVWQQSVSDERRHPGVSRRPLQGGTRALDAALEEADSNPDSYCKFTRSAARGADRESSEETASLN